MLSGHTCPADSTLCPDNTCAVWSTHRLPRGYPHCWDSTCCPDCTRHYCLEISWVSSQSTDYLQALASFIRLSIHIFAASWLGMRTWNLQCPCYWYLLEICSDLRWWATGLYQCLWWHMFVDSCLYWFVMALHWFCIGIGSVSHGMQWGRQIYLLPHFIVMRHLHSLHHCMKLVRACSHNAKSSTTMMAERRVAQWK